MTKHITNLTKKTRILLAALTITASVGLAGAQPADAAAVTPQQCHGTASITPKVQGLVTTTYTQLLISPGIIVPVAQRVTGVNVGQIVDVQRASGCASTESQIVYVRVRVIGFANGQPWSLVSDQWRHVKLAPGYQGTFPSLDIYPGSQVRYLHVDLDLQWWTAGDGGVAQKYLGRLWVSYSATGDYQCATGVVCYIGTDPTYGAFIGD